MAQCDIMTVGQLLAILSDKPLDMMVVFAQDGPPYLDDNGEESAWGVSAVFGNPSCAIRRMKSDHLIINSDNGYGDSDCDVVVVASESMDKFKE